MTIFIEAHAWRGISAAGGGLFRWIVLGWVTIGFAPFQITQRIDELTQQLRALVRSC